MAINLTATSPADIVSQVMGISQDQNLTDLKEFASKIQEKLQEATNTAGNKIWSTADNSIFTPKLGTDLTPEQQLSDFQRFWSLVLNQLVSTGKDPQSLLQTDGDLFKKLNKDLEALFAKVPAGETFGASDMKHLALLSVFSERLDNPILVTYQDRLFTNQVKRDSAQEELKGLSNELKIYGVIQSQIQQKISTNQLYKPGEVLTAKDFGYSNDTDFLASPEYEKLKLITGKDSGISSKDFLNSKGISSLDEYSSAKLGDEWDDKLSNLGTAISDKSKLINDDVSLKTTELNQISSTYNSTVEAINRFVQKYHSVMQDILRQI
ncbi:virulence-associated V antigen [Shewanella woodyi]|uniref:virulence-associated V antigen n=1 Tax=Shewanella woodyi TaxID=60961 RepID=UPI0037479A2B